MVPYDFDCPINQSKEEGGEDCELPKELAKLLKQEAKIIQPHQEAIEIINLGTNEEKKEVKIGATLQDVDTKNIIELLHEYVDVFAWSYQNMAGLDTCIIVHKLLLREEYPHVK